MTEKVMEWLEEIKTREGVDKWLELLETLRGVTEGKVSVAFNMPHFGIQYPNRYTSKHRALE